MKQVLQSLRSGLTEVVEVPVPKVSCNSLLIQTTKSLISKGTESMLIEFGKANWIEKVLKQPDKVNMVVDKIRTDGIKTTFDTVFHKLEKPVPMGYCNVGFISEVGDGINNFSIGDRVVSNGNHAEFVDVPANLCVKVPNSISDEEASFTVLGAIALQGIRLAKPTIGESVAVIGLGLVGLITVQLLLANGCRVLGLDFDLEKLKLAKKFGAEVVDLSKEDPKAKSNIFSRGRGLDAVIITAATKSDKPIHQAAEISRKRGRIILIGQTGLKLSRDDFYKKELSFQVSASYGPGRYDENYEKKGQDYPFGFVRWTAQRNFEAVLDMLDKGALDVKSLISHRFDITKAVEAYKVLVEPNSSLGILLDYSENDFKEKITKVYLSKDYKLEKINNNQKHQKLRVSFLGSGNYATSILIPSFKNAGVELISTTSNSGVSGLHAGKKYNFLETTTDSDKIFEDKNIDLVVISSRHDSHAKYVLKAIQSNKHVYVEKPLCLTLEELTEIKKAYSNSNTIMIGFNRRFAPQVQKIKNLLKDINTTKAMIMTVNAGQISKDHWTQNLEIGGGRIVGEVCHFIDLLRFLVGEKIVDYRLKAMKASLKDTVSIQLSFLDGSIGTIHYLANGPKSFPKERLEIFSAGKVLQLDNFRKLTGFGWSNFNKMNLWKQNKGHGDCIKTFIDSLVRNNVSPININEIFEVSEISIKLANQ